MTLAFVTGGSGFVGSALVRELLSDGVEVRALVRSTTNQTNLQGLDLELIEGDLLDEDSLRVGLQGCDVVYHVAAYYSTREEDATLMYDVNVRGTKSILNLAVQAGAQKIVCTSTIGTIGLTDDGTLPTEESEFNLWETASHYARSKYMAETMALGLGEQGYPVVVVNPCAPVGPRDIKPSSTGKRILDYLRNVTPSFVSGGINFVAVEDVARGHILAAERGAIGQRYILGNVKGNLYLSDFLDMMEAVSGISRPSVHRAGMVARARSFFRRGRDSQEKEKTGRSHRPMSLTCNPAKALEELGLPQTPLELAFERSIRWFRDSGYV